MRFFTIYTIYALTLTVVPFARANFHYGIYNCFVEEGGYINAGMIVPANKDTCTKIWHLWDVEDQIPPDAKYPNATIYGKRIGINLAKLTWNVINGTQHGHCAKINHGAGKNSTCTPVGDGADCNWNDRVVCYSSLS
ncbi:hypothetical protein BS47DRAFT_1351084 [Hydnum rufescens UP504]|uniref:Uncharacterized protein n=1 Tax=Hydnum rufescens UP504 TaxID=1448309 RepID=A0A9P6ALS8_9AGAM|nr:hypothetical protein BS47DRAFT_1351084 [Hydnum rufescens UP504]